MENVVLAIHLILALLLIGVVLLQRSEGGGLGIGGGGNAMAARSQATGLTKLTWILAVCFIITSITLTVLATRSGDSDSVLDSLSPEAPAADAPATPVAPALGGDLLPPSGSDAPATPPQADEPPAPATTP
jgi:preprotein translocase subunit SecG